MGASRRCDSRRLCGIRRWSRCISLLLGELATKCARRYRLGALNGHGPLVCKLVAAHRLCRGHGQWFRVWIPSPPSATALSSLAPFPPLPLRLMWRAVVEARNVHPTSVPACVFGQPVWMSLELMRLEIHFGIEYNKLLVQTLLIRTCEMVFTKMNVQGVVIDIVLRIAASSSPVADVAPLMLVSAMGKELVVAVEALAAKATFGVPLEATLINCSRIVVAVLFMFAKLCKGKEFMLVRKDFLVSRAEITRLISCILVRKNEETHQSIL